MKRLITPIFLITYMGAVIVISVILAAANPLLGFLFLLTGIVISYFYARLIILHMREESANQVGKEKE